jgi:hypothetical protein
VAVIQYSAADGRRQRVLYQHAYRNLGAASLTVDPSGRYPLFGLSALRCASCQFGSETTFTWWIDNGSPRALPTYGDDLMLSPFAW